MLTRERDHGNPSVSVRVSIVVMKHHDERNLGITKKFTQFTLTTQFIITGSQGRNSSRKGT